MADYIYLLENRLSAAQQAALQVVRTVSRAHGLTVFLVGGAVRDLTSGSPVRDLDVVVQGNALKLKKEIELAGGVVTGETTPGQALFVRFPGGVRIEIGSTLSVTYPKPGKPVLKPATILEDLRRRDFTANAMALSLNEGSYGLLMDPLNGVADIENRQLRLVSNYGFIEDPARMIRAARFEARLGWTMDEKTQARYASGKDENYIGVLGDFHRGYETEEIFHEEDPLRILRKLEEEGWMKQLFPALTVAKANMVELDKLREVQTQLQMRGVHPEAAAANFPLLTAKLQPKELADLKASFVRPGFVAEIEALEGEAKEVASQLAGKGAALPSQAWKLLVSAKPEAVLWVAYSSKSGAIQAKLKSFFTEWPQARNKIPYTLMQEMRIVPELAGFDEIVEKLFFELMDGNLGTVEEMKAFLETYSPPAPPPPVHLRRARAAKKDAKGRKKAVAVVEDDDADDLDDDADESDAPSADTGSDDADASEEDEQESSPEPSKPVPAEESKRETPVEAKPEPKPEHRIEEAPTKAASKVVSKPVLNTEKDSSRGKAAASKPVAPQVLKSKAPVPAKVQPPTTAAHKSPAKKAGKPEVKVATKAPAKVALSKPKAGAPPAKTAQTKVSGRNVHKAAPSKAAPAKASPAKKPSLVKSASKAAAKPVPAKKAVPAKKVVAKKTATKKR